MTDFCDRFHIQLWLKQLSRESCGLVVILISAMMCSVQGCFVKLAANTGIPSTQLVFCRALFQGSVVIIGMLFCEQHGVVMNAENAVTRTSQSPVASIPATATCSVPKTSINKKLIWVPLGSSTPMKRVVLLRGWIGGCCFLCYFYSISTIPLGDAISLLSLYPMFTVLLARACLGEKLRPLHVLACLCGCIGAILIAGPPMLSFADITTTTKLHTNNQTASSSLLLGYTIALIGSFLASGAVIFLRMGGKVGAHTLQLMFSWVMFGLLFSVVIGGAMGRSNNTLFGNTDSSTENKKSDDPSLSWHLPPSKDSWLFILGMSFFGSLGHFCLNYAGRIAPAGLTSIMKSTDVLWAYVAEIILFQQIPSITTSVGAMLVMLSPMIIAGQKLTEQQQQQQQQQLQHHQQHGHNNEQNSCLINGIEQGLNTTNNNQEKGCYENYGATTITIEKVIC